MIDGEYIVRIINLPGSINGAVRLSDDGFANIYINDQLSPMARRRAFDHERRHIENNDFYNDKSIMEVESCQESESKN